MSQLGALRRAAHHHFANGLRGSNAIVVHDRNDERYFLDLLERYFESERLVIVRIERTLLYRGLLLLDALAWNVRLRI